VDWQDQQVLLVQLVQRVGQVVVELLDLSAYLVLQAGLVVQVVQEQQDREAQ
jgi:hypothetical protein